MDRSWMKLSRVSNAYRNGVETFLNFAFQNASQENMILCPCKKCGNINCHFCEVVYEHLIVDGFIASDDCNIGGNVFCETGTSAPDEEPNEEAAKFYNLLNEMNEELYEGSKYLKLSFCIRLFHLKCLGGWTENSFTMLLEFLREMFPFAKIPQSCQDIKRLIKDLGLGYDKIHSCPNDCMLYWGDQKNQQSCHVCGKSHWMNSSTEDVNSDEVGAQLRKKPIKVLRYFPLIPRLQRLFMSSKTVESMRWHNDQRTDDGLLRHPVDSLAWKLFDSKFPSFVSDPQNVRLGLAADGFNPFKIMSTSYSTWTVVLVPYNLPLWICMKQSSFILSMIIPREKGPGNDIDIYLQPLIEELKQLWSGVETYDVLRKENFNLRAALLWTINDFPAYANLSGKKLCCTNLFEVVEHNILRHNLDVMHIKKNVRENIIGKILNVDEKSKDNLQSQLDLVDMRIRRDLHLQVLSNRKYRLPPSISLTSKEEKEVFCMVLKDIKVIQLPHEVILSGPVFYRWMYPIERFLSKLKSYCRNKRYPEGSIAEGYLAEECMAFCSRYLEDVETGLNRPSRNAGLNDHNLAKTYLFQSYREPIGKVEIAELDDISWIQAHRYVWSGKDVNDEVKWLSQGSNRVIKRYSAFLINGYRFHTKYRERMRRTQNCGVVVNSSITSYASARDSNPVEGNVEYYGLLTDIIELDNYGRWKKKDIVVGSSNVPEILDEPGDFQSSVKGRGRTLLKDLYELDPVEHVKVSRNSHGQPIGSEARLLAGCLGILARNANLLPINYESWHHMPDSNKNQALANIKERFPLEVSDDYIKKTLGSRSFASVAEAEEVSSGQKFGRLQLFEITHRKKDGSSMTSEAGEIMEKLKEKKAEYEAIALTDSSVNLENIDNRIITEVLGPESQAQAKVQMLRDQIAQMQANTVEQIAEVQRKYEELQQQLRAEAAEREAAAAVREAEAAAMAAEQTKKYDDHQLQLQQMMHMFQQSQKPPSLTLVFSL
ncbi:hypothetical protein CXB51_019310 [Gossypium anomalum]|uniref:Transposase-associated domain-containing protein n=1 Tax=Gossypium anomalum TaxID=47600 RepID=A0A8J5YNZ3_9ROSI|nr:hypothetical protein CXB51_019310 [Gossypium anomalum]